MLRPAGGEREDTDRGVGIPGPSSAHLRRTQQSGRSRRPARDQRRYDHARDTPGVRQGRQDDRATGRDSPEVVQLPGRAQRHGLGSNGEQRRRRRNDGRLRARGPEHSNHGQLRCRRSDPADRIQHVGPDRYDTALRRRAGGGRLVRDLHR